MTRDLSTARPSRTEPLIKIPALGLTVRVRFSQQPGSGNVTIVETTNAPRLGPPMYRRAEVEIFEVVSGRYLFQVDDTRFVAKRGDLVRIPSGAARAFVNLTSAGARQKVIYQPGIDATAYFTEFAKALEVKGHADQPAGTLQHDVARARLEEFGDRWGITFLGPPLRAFEEAEFGKG